MCLSKCGECVDATNAAMQEGRGNLFRLDALLGESCRQKEYSKFCPRSVIVDSIVDRTLRLGGFVDLQICESMKLDLNNMCDWMIISGFTPWSY